MRIWKAPKMKRKDLLLFLRRKHTFYVQYNQLKILSTKLRIVDLTEVIYHFNKNTTMKKIEIVEHVINNTTISRSQAIQAVDCVFDAIENSLCRGESVYIRGFATIKAHTSKRKKARNISKGTTVVIPAQRSAKLIISKQLKARMNL